MARGAVLLIRRRRPAGEPSGIESDAAARGGQRTEGTTGAGRMIASLSELGLTWTAVTQVVLDADASAAELARVDVGERFEGVILGSHLVNALEADRRAALVDVAVRHLTDRGTLLLEHHPVDWAETAADVEPIPAAAVGMLDVRREPPFVSAVSVYDAGGRVTRQPFRARVLSEAELETALAEHDLAVRRRLSPTWLEAGRPTT